MPESAASILSKYPQLNDYFPYGFWFADGCYTWEYCVNLPEHYDSRLQKILHNLARYQVNCIIPSNRSVYPGYLNLVQKYGLMSVSPQNYLGNARVDIATPLTDEQQKQVNDQWDAQIPNVVNHPALLAWHVVDEPHPNFSPSIKRLKEKIESKDSSHPVLYTHQNLPINYCPAEVDLVRSMDVILSDCYSLNEDFGFDPWLYGDYALSEFYRLNPHAFYWPIIQSFDYGKMPTLSELRLMIYHTIGNGAKGMFFFTTEQSGFTWDAPGYMHMYNSPGNAWFAEDDLLKEIGRVGYYLTSAGPLLIPLQYTPNYTCKVDADQISVKVDAKRIRLRSTKILRMPAIHVGGFRGNDYDVLVVSNADHWKNRKGKVSVFAGAPAKRKIYDLYDLKEVPAVRSGSDLVFDVNLIPGDGRLYMLGNEDSFAEAKQTVLRHRYERAALLASLDTQFAQIAKVNTSAVQELLDKASQQASQKNYARAAITVKSAAAKLQQVEKQNKEYYKVKSSIESLRAGFTAIDNKWKTMKATDIPVADKQTMLQLTKRFGDLENQFREGNLNAAETDSLTVALKAFGKTVGVRI